MILGKDNIERLPPPVGTSDWATFSRDSYCVEALLRDETPRVPMAKELGPYSQIKARKDSLYALLVSAGYLKVASPLEEGRCRVAIPNHEVAQVFVSDIRAKINIVDIEKIGLAYCKDKVELCR